MSRELDILAQEYKSKKATVMSKGISVYQSGITTASSGFLRTVEAECKRQNQSAIKIIAIIPESEQKERTKIKK
jgi:hypothetical protein